MEANPTNPKAEKRVLGLDLGDRTLGVAVSDPFGWTASEVTTIRRKEENKLRQTLAQTARLIEEYGADTVVLGYPVNMDGTPGPRAEKSKAFGEALARRTGVKVILWDERLSTVEADELMAQDGIPASQRKKTIDARAAAVILQGWLDFGKEKADE